MSLRSLVPRFGGGVTRREEPEETGNPEETGAAEELWSDKRGFVFDDEE